MAQRTAAISGASAGIGVAIARELARRGMRVAIGARRRERLEQVAAELRALGGEVHAELLDVASADSVDAFYASAERALGPIDVIVNNAGRSLPHALQEYPPELLRAEFETNVIGAALFSRRGVGALLAADLPGDVVFMSSDAVKHPRPTQLTYGSSKAALENFADGLALELEGSGVRVLKLRIGPTWSEFGNEWPRDVEPLMARMALWGRVGLRDARMPGVMMQPEHVAQALAWAIEQPPGVWIDTIEMQPGAPKRPRAEGGQP